MRIVVIGNSGSGKSTLARRLAAEHGLAMLELDAIVWEPHRVAVSRPADAVRADLARFLAEHERWVIEGCDGDLAELALVRATELVFLNPGTAACVANNKRRPWEPHKYDDAAAQERMLPFLLGWVAAYDTRDNHRSLGYHRRLFDAHTGDKRELGAATARVACVVPRLRGARVEPLLGGWTSETYDAGGEIVQIARSSYAERTLRHQVDVLPRLAPRLPVAVPAPRLACETPVAVTYAKLEGAPAELAELDGAWPEQLGRALRALHAIDPAELGLPATTAAELRDRARARCADLRATLAAHLTAGELAAADRITAASLEDWRFVPVPTHGDLGPEHVLVGPSGELRAIIDWEELGPGDPASDLAWWIHARPDAGARMLAAYGDDRRDVDLRRARVVYAMMPWGEVDHGVRVGDLEIVASGLAGTRARLAWYEAACEA